MSSQATAAASAAAAAGAARRSLVTMPVSEQASGPTELRYTEELMDVMREFKLFESEEGSRRREVVLGALNEILKEWVKNVSISMGLTGPLASSCGTRIFTSGSYRLGIHKEGSDIDTVCVGPHHVERRHFFNELYQILQSDPRVTHLKAIPDAFVPLMGFAFDGVEIDLMYCQLHLQIIPDEFDIFDNNIFKNMEYKSVRSLCGPRDSDMIIRLVPHVEHFRCALRAIRFWASRRGIYSNAFGFLGGISWAILLAKTCQMYPNLAPSELIHKFFFMYSRWWKNQNPGQIPRPIMIAEIEHFPNIGHQVWDPKMNPIDGRDRMPIITPAYPAMNSTHNVSDASKRMLQAEFDRGFAIMSEMRESRAEVDSRPFWRKLLADTEIFLQHKDFVCVKAIAPNDADLQTWKGYIESKVRHLVSSLDYIPRVQAFPYPKSFSWPTEGHPFCECFFIAIDIDTSDRANEHIPITQRKTVDLSNAVSLFVRGCEERNPIAEREPERAAGMRLVVEHIKATQLPDFVFKDDRRPERKKKKKADPGAVAAPPASVPFTKVPPQVESAPLAAAAKKEEQDQPQAHAVDASSSAPSFKKRSAEDANATTDETPMPKAKEPKLEDSLKRERSNGDPIDEPASTSKRIKTEGAAADGGAQDSKPPPQDEKQP